MRTPETDRHTEAMRRLLDEAACRELVLRAAALADGGQPDALAAVFTGDAHLTRPNGVVLEGREAIARAYRDRPGHRITVHLVCGTLFDEVGPDHASATSRVLLWAGDLRAGSGPQGRAAEGRQVVGRFVDRFVRTAEGWRIDRRVACFDLHTPDVPVI
jgi:ketosteroid isomerase-like protein